jgi:glycosyltransferase involved in cell wall biosynthesis
MRIVHLDSGREMRGGQWQVLALHRGLVAQGISSLLLARPGSPLLARAAVESLPVVDWSKRRLMAESGKADLVHAHDARSHTIAALLARCPLVVSRRVAFPVRDSALSRWKYSRPARFLAVSRFVAGQLEAAGVAAERIRVVYDGVAVPENPAHGDALLTLHSDDPAKGMALAIAAAHAAGLPLQPSRDLTAELPHARAMLYLTYSEGLGSGILLAMAHGVPVIASRVGGIPELIEDGVHGILVPNDVEAIAAALQRISPAMGEAARLRAIREFTEEHMIENTVRAYQELLQSR